MNYSENHEVSEFSDSNFLKKKKMQKLIRKLPKRFAN